MFSPFFLLARTSETTWLIATGVLAILVGLAAGLWLWLGREPRRRRAYQQALLLIRQRSWQAALAAVSELQKLGPLPTLWQGRAHNALGQCHSLAGDIALQEGRYEEGLEHYLAAARVFKLDEVSCRDRVVETMLAEVRRLFATSAGADTQSLHALIDRILLMQPACAEAFFWRGLCHVREGRIDRALESLRDSVRACEGSGAGEGQSEGATKRESQKVQAQEGASAASGTSPLSPTHPSATPPVPHLITSPPHHPSAACRFIDPPLYLGVLLLRQGWVHEALRYLSQANRIDAACPFVSWQLGMAIVAAGGDTLAVRALQRALAPGGLPRWVKDPQRAWVDGFPDVKSSFVKRLALQHSFTCPLMGNDVAAMIRQGQMALAQAQYRLGHFEEAVSLYKAVLQEQPPSVPVLRGLGLALVQLERYDEAFTHLRIAYDMARDDSQDSRDLLITGYLALCAAKGKPLRPEDKPNNLRWAIQLLSQCEVRGNAEWARLQNAVFAEARAAGLAIALEDQIRLCNVLVSVEATDAAAAAAYDQLAATHPESVRREYAWLFCRAASEHGWRSDRELELFQRTFQEESAARAYYGQRQWDFDEIEFLYLERWASRRPGRFPEIPAPAYRERGIAFLLARSRRQEEAGQMDAALITAKVMRKLAPDNPLALDRLAYLHYRRCDLIRAVELLAEWENVEPANHVPVLRRAVIEQQRGRPASSAYAIDRALALARGRVRAAVAFLGGRLALTQVGESARKEATECESHTLNAPEARGAQVSVPVLSFSHPNLHRAERLFHECLKEEPGHVEALWCLAAVRCLRGDRQALADQSPVMNRPDVNHPNFHFFTAVCRLAAGDYTGAIEACQRATADPFLGREGAHLIGLAHIYCQAPAAAIVELQKVLADGSNSPSADHTKALLGRLYFRGGAYEDAARFWSDLNADRRTQWKFAEPLRQTVFLTGLLAYRAGRFEDALERFSRAEALGLRCRPLLTLARIKAAQQLLYHKQSGASAFQAACPLLEEAVKANSHDAQLAYLLALAHKRLGHWPQAREALAKIIRPDASVYLQLGLLAFCDNRLAEAERDFACAWQSDPASYAAGYNLLLSRLSLGQLEAALALIPAVIERAPTVEGKRQLTWLQDLLGRCRPQNGEYFLDPRWLDMSEEDEQHFLSLVRSLGHLETADALLQALAEQRPNSSAVQEAVLEVAVVKAKQWLDRCNWTEAARLLVAQSAAKAGRSQQVARLNLLGCCACLSQNFEDSVRCFLAALKLAGHDPRLFQNLALAYELQDQPAQAEPHWERFLDLLQRPMAAPLDPSSYRDQLAYACLSRLAGRASEKGHWSTALSYLNRAQELRPDDLELLERLFEHYKQMKRPQDALQIVRQIQGLRPNEHQFDLYELDLIELKTSEDVERVLADLDLMLKKYPGHLQVEERAMSVIANLINALTRLSQNLTDQLSRSRARLRRLPSYQIDWPEALDFARHLRSRFGKLRRAVNKCLTLVIMDGQRRVLLELNQQIDRQMEMCRSLGR